MEIILNFVTLVACGVLALAVLATLIATFDRSYEVTPAAFWGAIVAGLWIAARFWTGRIK